MGIRAALRQADAAFEVLDAATPADLGSPPGEVAKVTAEMLDLMKHDIAKARAAFRFVLAQRSINSQIIDNLNASTHVRTLLTDLFLLDEAFEKGSSS